MNQNSTTHQHKFNYFTVHNERGTLIGSARVLKGSLQEKESVEILLDEGFILRPVTSEEYYVIEKKWSV